MNSVKKSDIPVINYECEYKQGERPKSPFDIFKEKYQYFNSTSMTLAQFAEFSNITTNAEIHPFLNF